MRTRQTEDLAKTALDRAGAAALIVLLSPLLIGIALAVKLSSRGPILFAQERLGHRGTRFRMYKFRTMCAGAEEMLHALPYLRARYVAGGYKLADADDPRITAVGQWLRRSGLDELPQLLNVLGGAMSLVGPRPIVPPELDRYPDYLSVVDDLRPGITGCWQVSGIPAGNYTRRAELERHYATSRSLWLDLALLLRTLGRLGTTVARIAAASVTVRAQPSAGSAAPRMHCDQGVSADE